jgi:hypothetical protein
MRRIRFTIATLLVVVVVFAVGIAALRESNEIWDSGLFSLTFGVLLISILLGVHRTESRRAFWLGFAIFGCGYLALSLAPSIESRLITTKALAFLDSKVPGRSLGRSIRLALDVFGEPANHKKILIASTDEDNPHNATSQGVLALWDATTAKLLVGWAGTTENFVRIGHSLFALLAGWLGGLLSRRLWQASRPPELETTGFLDSKGTHARENRVGP